MKWSSGIARSADVLKPEFTSSADLTASQIAPAAVFSPKPVGYLFAMRHIGPLVPCLNCAGASGNDSDPTSAGIGLGCEATQRASLRARQTWMENVYASMSSALYRISTVPVGLFFSASANRGLRYRQPASLRTYSTCFWSCNCASAASFWACAVFCFSSNDSLASSFLRGRLAATYITPQNAPSMVRTTVRTSAHVEMVSRAARESSGDDIVVLCYIPINVMLALFIVMGRRIKF
jgi:hypothetical protein